MRINTKFPVAVHIMVLLHVLGEEYSTSEKLARSVNTNPVVIRRINAMLKKAGLITINAGIGGATLNREPKKITLFDIYQAVKTSQDGVLFDMHSNPNPYCFVGANIHCALSDALISAQKTMEKELSKFTLADVIKKLPVLSEKELDRQRKM